MSSEAAGANGGAVLDTSWINEPAGGSGGATSRGRGGSKRRTRRRTLSPSIGKHNYMSNVDFNDPMNFPSLPSSGGSKIPSSSSSSNCSSSSNSGGGGGADVPADDAAAEGALRLMVVPRPPPSSPSREGTAVSADPPSAAAGYSASPSHSATSQDADMPDPTVIAGLFDIEGVPITSPGPGPGPGPLPLGTLGALGNLEVVNPSSSVSQKKKEAEPRSSGKEPRGSTARGRNNRRATFGGVNTRAFLEAENLEPVLPSKPPARAAVDAAAAAATKASPSTTTTAEVQVGAGQLQGSSNLATAPQGDVGGEERENSQPRAAKQKSRSRSSRRRSIVMPSEAQPLMDSDLDDGRAEHATAVAAVAAAPAPASASASPTSTNKGGDSAAGKETAATASGDGKSKPGGSSEAGSSGKTTPSEEFPLSSVNATSCLSRSLAAQRGWALGDQDTRKQLFRAYYAAGPGSQRARRIAARLFCLTGYALSPVAPEDARALCAAAGDGMDWGLDETEPRLVSQPIRRETKEQKRELVLRIKPLFDLMEKASSKEKLSAEAATGVVSRKASPDGYRYEDRETGKPVDPDAYKVPYLEHVRAVRASRVKGFAAQRVTAPSTAPTLPEAVNSSSTPAAGVVASLDNGTISPVEAAASPATATVAAREVGEARLEEGVKPAAAATEADLGTEAANVDVAEESPKEGKLLEDVSVPDEVLAAEASSDEGPLEETDAAATSAAEDKVCAGSVGVEEEDDGVGIVGEVDSAAVFPDVGPRAPATPATAVPGDGGSPAAAATSVSGGEATIAVEQGPAAAIWEKDAAAGGTACAESETLIAVEPTALLVGGVEDDGEADDAAVEDAEVEDANAHGETLGASSAVVAGDDVETPCCSSLAAGDVCTPGAASASSGPLSTRSDEPDKLCDVRDAAIVSPAVSYAGQEAPRDCGPDSSGEVSSGWGGEMSSSPCLSEAPSPALANDGRIASPATASPACAEPVLGEACGDDSPLAFGDSGEGEGSERIGESGAAAPGGSPPSPGRPGPSPRGSTEHDASDEGSAAAPCSPFSTSPAAAAAAASPLVTAGGHGLQQEEPMSGRTPQPVESARREFPSRERPTPPYPFGDAGSPAMSEIAATPGEDEEGAEEIAALKDRLWTAWDAAVLEYEEGVALVRSKYNRSTPAASTTTAQKESAMVSRSPGDAFGPTPKAGVAETSRQEGSASASGPKATATPAPSVASAEETVAEEPAEVVPTAADGMPTPDSPLLPLLQLRLEEGDLFEYSSSWRGSGTGGEGSSQAGGGKPRRRSLAKAFSSHKTRKGPKVQEAVSMTAGKMQGAGDSPAQETGESETGGSEGSDGAAAMLCRLCCRKSCDTVLRPCEHSACGVCVEKIRLQAEQSGQALSCPWDRKLVDAICPV